MSTIEAIRSKQGISPLLRLVLYKNEVFHLPAVSQEIRVLSGVGWVTAAGKDIILGPDEKIDLSGHEKFVLISALGQSPLIFEVSGNRCSAWIDKPRPQLGGFVNPPRA